MHRLGRLGEGALSTPATRCPGWTGNGSSQATFVPDPPDVWGSVLEGRSSDLSRVTWIGCWDSSLGLNPKLLGGGSKEGETTCTRHSNHATTRRNGASWPTLRRAARSVPSSPVSAPQRPKRHQSQGCHCLIPNLRSRSWPGRSGHLRAGREPQAGPHVAAGSFKFCWLAVYLVARSKMKKKTTFSNQNQSPAY